MDCHVNIQSYTGALIKITFRLVYKLVGGTYRSSSVNTTTTVYILQSVGEKASISLNMRECDLHYRCDLGYLYSTYTYVKTHLSTCCMGDLGDCKGHMILKTFLISSSFSWLLLKTDVHVAF